MSTDVSNSSGSPNDELDLGQLFTLVRKAFLGVFKFFLRLFVYARKNIVWLAVLGIVGAGLGFGLKNISSEKLKTEVLVSPKLETKHYLYDVISEINAKIKSQDTVFFSSLGIESNDIEKFEVTAEPVSNRTKKERELDLKYLEALEPFQNSPVVAEIIKDLLLDQNSANQRITFFYKNPDTGPDLAKKLMQYINDNNYYTGLISSYNENAAARIKQNDIIISQLDGVLMAYKGHLESTDKPVGGQLVLEEGESLDISALFELKNILIAQNESKRIELQMRKEPLTIINFGQNQTVKIPLFGKYVILLPTLLIGIFLLINIIKYLNKKSKELLPE